jgi:hypothetical protein
MCTCKFILSEKQERKVWEPCKKNQTYSLRGNWGGRESVFQWLNILYSVVRCQTHSVPDNVRQLYVQQPSTYATPEAASAVLGS